MNYPINLIKNYREQKITRGEFCRQFAAMQGFNNEAAGHADTMGSYIEYRGRCAELVNDFILWQEGGKYYKARSVKELKIKIDIMEMKKARA